MLFIQAQRDDLLKPLQSVTGIVERRHTLPILSNVLMEARDNQLTFVATDLEIQITATVAIRAGHDFAVTTSAKKLQDILRALPSATEVSLDADAGRLQIRAARSRFNLQTLPADDFPQLNPPDAPSFSLTLSQRVLKQLLHHVQYAMAQQDMRYYLNGLYFVANADALHLVATDGHRLSLASSAPSNVSGAADVILPRKTVLELVKLLEDSDAEVSLQVGHNQVHFNFGHITLVSKLIDGKFPDYNRVIPTNYQNHLVIERSMLLSAMQRAAILSNEKFRGVRLVLSDSSLRVMCTNTDQEEAEEELEVQYEGAPIDIGFNVTYLLDVLNNLSAPAVRLSFGDASNSCLITVPGDDSYKFVVMPMRI